MASKGQKFKTYSSELKEEIIEKLREGYSVSDLSRNYKISIGTISTWQQKIRYPEKYLGAGQKRGRPKESELSQEDWKERYEILKKYQAFLKAQRGKR